MPRVCGHVAILPVRQRAQEDMYKTQQRKLLEEGVWWPLRDSVPKPTGKMRNPSPHAEKTSQAFDEAGCQCQANRENGTVGPRWVPVRRLATTVNWRAQLGELMRWARSQGVSGLDPHNKVDMQI